LKRDIARHTKKKQERRGPPGVPSKKGKGYRSQEGTKVQKRRRAKKKTVFPKKAFPWEKKKKKSGGGDPVEGSSRKKRCQGSNEKKIKRGGVKKWQPPPPGTEGGSNVLGKGKETQGGERAKQSARREESCLLVKIEKKSPAEKRRKGKEPNRKLSRKGNSHAYP